MIFLSLQAGLSDQPSLSDSKCGQIHRRTNSLTNDFTSDCIDDYSRFDHQAWPSENQTPANLHPWSRPTENHTNTSYNTPFQHHYPRPPRFDSNPPSNYRGIPTPSPRPPNYGNTQQHPPPLMGPNICPPPIRENQWSHTQQKGPYTNFHQTPPPGLPDRGLLTGPTLLPKIDIETVPSEKLFDIPARKNRPSHVSA